MEPLPAPAADLTLPADRLGQRAGAWLRRAWRAVIEYAWDNPTAEHDERAILVGPKVGLWLGLLLLVVISGAAFAFLALPAAEPSLRAALAELGPGPYLIAATQASLALFLTMIVPLRAVGLLEGPRWRGYLDQLVTTGITPWRYYAGKWATTQPFLLALLGATLPLTALFALLGGFDPGRALVGYLLLFAYGNLLLAVALALGVVLHELMALLLTWALFLGLSVLDYLPVPATLAAWTPHRYFVQPFVPHLAGSEAEALTQLFGTARPLGLELPWIAWALLAWALVGGLAVLACGIGPLHAFQPGLNNFGAVVLPGDRARTILRRVRPFLQRKVELAFLFENRGPRLVRWTLAVRGLGQLIVLALLAVTIPAAALDPALLGSILGNSEEVEILHCVACGLVLLLSLVALANGRRDEQRLLAIGRHRIPLLAIDLFVFLAVCALLVLTHCLVHAGAWEALEELSRLRGRHPPQELWTKGAATLAALVVTAASTFMVMKTLGGRAIGQAPLLLLTLLYLVILLIAPLFAVGLSAALSRADEVPAGALALVRPLWVLGEVSPITHLIVVWEDRLPPWLDAEREAPWLLRQAFWVWQPAWILLLLPRFCAQLLGTRDAGAAQERRQKGLPPLRPCQRCPAGHTSPLRFSWWGGLVGPWLLSYVHCHECGASYSTRSGRAAWGGMLLIFALRLLVTGLVAGLLVATLVGQLWGLR